MKHELFFQAHPRFFELAVVSLTMFVATCILQGAMTVVWAQERISEPGQPAFPTMESALWKDGTFPSVEALRQVKPGMDKDQVRSLLGVPHFREGIAGVKEWNYIFHFRVPGAEVMTCQYLIRFGDAMQTTGSYWQTPECAAFVEPPVAKIFVKAVSAIEPPSSVPQILSLSADDMFLPDEANAAELRVDGLRIVELLASEIRRGFGSSPSVFIRAHTDRTRSEVYGDALSLGQANAIRNVLIRSGLDASAVRAMGAGSKQPLVDCPSAAPSRDTAACLRANRRIDIEVIGAQ